VEHWRKHAYPNHRQSDGLVSKVQEFIVPGFPTLIDHQRRLDEVGRVGASKAELVIPALGGDREKDASMRY